MVVSSDTDRNHHVNTAGYIKYCMDAGSHAATNGNLTVFHKDLTYSNVRRLSLSFLGEAVIGDQHRIACWEDREDKLKLNFEILKSSTAIVQCQIQFVDPGNIYRQNVNVERSKL